MSEVVKCPVCNGRGIVPQGFYMVPEGQNFSSSSTAPETCKTCGGKGYFTFNNAAISNYKEVI